MLKLDRGQGCTPFSRKIASTARRAKCTLSPVKILLLSVVMAIFIRSCAKAKSRLKLSRSAVACNCTLALAVCKQ